MSDLTWKQKAFIDEYLKDYNGTQAAIRAGYSEDSAYSIASENLRKPEIAAELQRRMNEGRMTTEEIVARIEGMVEGRIPTKVIEMPSKTYGKPTYRREYDTQGAVRDLGKVYALFVERVQTEEITGLEIVDDQDSGPKDPPSTS